MAVAADILQTAFLNEEKDMQGYFYGWYLKCQSETYTLAVIPAVHRTGRKCTCSVQIITEDGAWTADFPCEAFRRRRKSVRIDKNLFCERGIRLSVHTPELTAEGKLIFGPLWPLKYDIMGPFSLVPFMECRHSVWSMCHSVNGKVCINGQNITFRNAVGYWEGDRGRSFPKEYVWTQCCFPGGSLMLSVADIPIAGMHFTGIIGVVVWRGKEYRLVTYLGARADKVHDRKVRVVQGKLVLEAWLLEAAERPLKAPANGNMARTIQESAACRAFYSFRKGKQVLFSFETDKASFEYEYCNQDAIMVSYKK